MKKQKRLLAFLMAVVLLCAMLPINAAAAILAPWQFQAFGNGTSTDNNAITNNSDSSVTLFAKGGKLAPDNEGLSFYYEKLSNNDNFEIHAKALVKNFNKNASTITSQNQKAFGLMLRGDIVTGNSPDQTSNYVAVGGGVSASNNTAPTVMQVVYKQGMTSTAKGGANTKLTLSGVKPPTENEVYDLKIKKSGNAFELTVNGVVEKVALNNVFASNAQIYAGLFVARDAEITFSNFDVIVDSRVPSQLIVDSNAMKKEYLKDELLDTTGLKVTAVYADHTEEILSGNDYIITGFNSSKLGANSIAVNFNGATQNINLNIVPLSATALGIKYLPVKTDYYIGDQFDPEGLLVTASYNSGTTKDFIGDDKNKYVFSIPEATVTNVTYTFNTPGTKTVVIRSNETPTTFTTFNVTVKAAQMTDLVIRQLPQKTVYYTGQDFDQAGIAVYAKYSDQTEVRLMRSEFAITPVDMNSAGTKVLTVSTYKGVATQSFPITVTQRAVTGIEISQYPKTTTYAIGESLNTADLTVMKVYDSGYKELMPSNQYDVVDTTFDNTKAGVYNLQIVPHDSSIPPILFPVTVTAPRTYEWKSIRFGQSTSSTSNKVNVTTAGSAVQLVALEGGGKVTGDHDGISFYYVELDPTKDNFELSANIKVSAYAKDTGHDGQESFGIMARDAIGNPDDSSIFASNIAAIGGYSGGTTKPNGTQLFVRTGITSPDGAGSQGVQSKMLKEGKPTLGTTYPAVDYKLTLIKTNSGFSGRLNNGTTESFFAPDIMKVQDQNKMYVGFYTARLATIDVSDISLKVSDATTDAPLKAPAPESTKVNVSLTGLARTSDSAYKLGLTSNVSGTATIKRGATIIKQDEPVYAGVPLIINTTVTANTYTNFSASFLPDDTQVLASYDKVVLNYQIDMKTLVDGGNIYVSSTATVNDGGDGTISHPLDLDTAIAYVRAGQSIILQDGRYVRNAKIDIPKGHDGTANARKSLVAAPDARPIIDFDKNSEGVVLSGNYWTVKGIDFTRSADNTKGFTVGGSNNIVENSRFYANGDTGLQISRTDDAEDKALWPSNNLILNCESYDNVDPSNNNADGFAAKLTAGIGNIFRGDISHNNIDDGWDLYTKAATGAIGAVLIEDSIAYNNGTLTNGSVGKGDKNGFKLGGEGIKVPHIIRNSIAFGNGAYGFSSNSNPGVIAESMNIAFNNAKGNLYFGSYTGIPLDFKLNGFISYQKDYTAKDTYPAALSSSTNYLWNGTKSVNQSGSQLTDANFASLVPDLPYQRDTAGNLIKGDFLRFIPTVVSSGSSGSSGGISDQETVVAISDGVQITSKATSEVVDGKTIATATVGEKDLAKALSMLEKLGDDKQSLVIGVDGSEHAAQVVLPAGALQDGSSDVTLSMRAMGVTYDLPLHLLKLADLAAALGTDVANMTIRITIEQGSAASEELVRSNIEGRGMSLLAHPIEFTIVAEANGKQQAVNDFGSTYVSRSFTLEGTVDANQSTAVWIDPVTGKFTFVPAIFTKSDGQTIVTMKRPGNSLYAVVKSSQTFDDVKAHWAKPDVELLASKGVIQGVTVSAFAPDAAITRAEFAALLVRAMGLNEDGASSATFKDIAPGSWYAGSVGAAAKTGLINGFEDATFRPSERITREQMAVMLTRAMTFAGTVADVDLKALAGFADANQVSVWSQDAVSQAIHAGIVKGLTATTFGPKADATRAEAAVMLKRFLQFVHFINE